MTCIYTNNIRKTLLDVFRHWFDIDIVCFVICAICVIYNVYIVCNMCNIYYGCNICYLRCIQGKHENKKQLLHVSTCFTYSCCFFSLCILCFHIFFLSKYMCFLRHICKIFCVFCANLQCTFFPWIFSHIFVCVSIDADTSHMSKPRKRAVSHICNENAEIRKCFHLMPTGFFLVRYKQNVIHTKNTEKNVSSCFQHILHVLVVFFSCIFYVFVYILCQITYFFDTFQNVRYAGYTQKKTLFHVFRHNLHIFVVFCLCILCVFFMFFCDFHDLHKKHKKIKITKNIKNTRKIHKQKNNKNMQIVSKNMK